MYKLDDSPRLTSEAIWFACAQVVILCVVGFAAYRRGCRPSTWGESAKWFGGMLVFAWLALLVHAASPEIPQYFFPEFVGCTWLLAAYGYFRDWTRKAADKETARGYRWSDLFGVAVILVAPLHLWLFPAISEAREAARRTQCKGHLKGIALALHNYESWQGQFPGSQNGNPPFSWRVAILPYLDQSALYKRYDFRSSWDSLVNEPIAKSTVSLFQCPSTVARNDPAWINDLSGRIYAHYAMVDGTGTVGRGVQPGEITDGAANTCQIVEACGLGLVWTSPNDTNIDHLPEGINLPGPRHGTSPGWMSSHHGQGVNAAFADGSVRFIPATIDPKVLRALMTIDAKDSTGDF